MNRDAHSREGSREIEWLERSEYQPFNPRLLGLPAL